ncbi:MAG: hypothetical protein AAB835_00480 [Patescibacteria group bacterium]
MGGTVVGIMYKIEKKFSGLSANKMLLWKILFVPAGFVAAYALLEQSEIVFIIAIAFLFLVSFTLLHSKSSTTGLRSETVGDIEKKMEDCC